MKILKKVIAFLLVFGTFMFVGCEDTNDLRSAYFTNITQPDSSNNTIRVTFEKDSRVDEKYVDIQVRSNKEAKIEINEENKQPEEISFDNTKWNSLTTLLVEGVGESGTEVFRKYKETQSKTYILKTINEIELCFRVVVGDSNENATKTGYILTNAKEVSKEFKIKLKPRT